MMVMVVIMKMIMYVRCVCMWSTDRGEGGVFIRAEEVLFFFVLIAGSGERKRKSSFLD
jgi:hypothetical protein